MDNNDSFLSNFGGIANNSLFHFINPNDHKSIVNDAELNPMQECHYYSDSNLARILSEQSNMFSILSLNIQSLNAKFDQLHIFVQQLRQSNHEFSAICLQESWLSNVADISLYQLEGYTLILQRKTCSQHGGLVIYLNNKYNYKNITLGEESQIWEKQFLEITRRNCTYKLILGNIYIPPCEFNDNYSLFNNELNLVLSQLNNLNCEAILAGEYNIDLLNINTKQTISEFFDMITCQSFFPKKTLPTRLSERRGTLLDNFLCKLSRKTTNVTSGILTKHISDHQPCFMTIDLGLPKPSTPKLVKIKKHDTDAITNLQEELANINISDKLDHDTKSNPNKNYNIIDAIITSLITKYFLTKTIKFNKHKH